MYGYRCGDVTRWREDCVGDAVGDGQTVGLIVWGLNMRKKKIIENQIFLLYIVHGGLFNIYESRFLRWKERREAVCVG